MIVNSLQLWDCFPLYFYPGAISGHWSSETPCYRPLVIVITGLSFWHFLLPQAVVLSCLLAQSERGRYIWHPKEKKMLDICRLTFTVWALHKQSQQPRKFKHSPYFWNIDSNLLANQSLRVNPSASPEYGHHFRTYNVPPHCQLSRTKWPWRWMKRKNETL